MRIDELEQEAALPGFWNDQAKARVKSRELDSLRKTVEGWDNLRQQVAEVIELAELAEDEPELLAELDEELAGASEAFEHQEFLLSLGGQYDAGDALVSIHAGAGGTEAQDWADMLMRMYLRWCDRRAFNHAIVDRTGRGGGRGQERDPGGQGGLRLRLPASRTRHPPARAHQPVRCREPQAHQLRQGGGHPLPPTPTSEIEIKPADLLIDTFRSSGAGGQHMQKNDTACRITHKPTGIVVSCQNERSLTQNKEQALKVLRGKLHAMEQEKIDRERARLKGENVQADFGTQIRNYVLHPYNLVKDLRTQMETGNTGAVLDGDLDRFMEEWLKHQIGL